MLKDRLKAIKTDMRDVRSNKADCQCEVRCHLRELERERKRALAECERTYTDMGSRLCERDRINRKFDQLQEIEQDRILNRWHSDQQYYLIYADGSEAIISAEEILLGEKFPRITGIVYAELFSADDHFDTETGDLYWYSEERLQACGYDYEAENDSKWQYETAIQYKYRTEWSRSWSRAHPEFVPQEIA